MEGYETIAYQSIHTLIPHQGIVQSLSPHGDGAERNPAPRLVVPLGEDVPGLVLQQGQNPGDGSRGVLNITRCTSGSVQL